MIDVEKIRKDFPILKRQINGYSLVYLDNGATSQKPKKVTETLVDYYQNHNANIHRGVHTLSAEATEMVDLARDKIVRFIGANSEKEVIFVRNASEGINLVMYTWGEENIEKGDAVVVGIQEHHSNLVTWQALCQKKGAELRVIDVDKEGRLLIEDLEKSLDEKVKLIAVTQVSNVLGTINPIEEIVKLIRKKCQAKILIDGSQSVPHMKVEVNKLGADFLVFSGHKMLGPTGSGVLWARQELLEKMPPFLYGGDMISEVTLKKTEWNQLPYKFEAGTPDIAGIIGLGAAVDYLDALGMKNVFEHEQELTGYALEKFIGLEKKGWLELYGPRSANERAGIITFNVKGVHAHDTAQVLDNFGIAVRSGQMCGAPLVERLSQQAVVRASFYLYNTKEEIDFLVEKLGEVRKVFKV